VLGLDGGALREPNVFQGRKKEKGRGAAMLGVLLGGSAKKMLREELKG